MIDNSNNEKTTQKNELNLQKNPTTTKIEQVMHNFANSKLGRFLTGFGNSQIAGESGIGTSMAIASGYLYNPETHRFELSEKNLKEAEGLRNNLAVLSEFSPTHPAEALGEFMFNGIRNLYILKKAKRGYTGVPHKLREDGRYMDEAFMDNFNKPIWTADNIDYVDEFASGRMTGGEPGQIFEVYGFGKTLLTPKTKYKNGVFNWQHLPFKWKNGKLVLDNPHVYSRIDVRKFDRNGNLVKDVTYADNKLFELHLDRRKMRTEPGLKTDDIVKEAKEKGYDIVKFNLVWDGSARSPITGDYYDPTLTEHVFLNQDKVYKFPLGTSTLKKVTSMPLPGTKFPIFPSLHVINNTINNE